MYNCYNEAYQYLRKKYGVKDTGDFEYGFVPSFREKLKRSRNEKERKAILASATDKDKMNFLNDIGEEDRVIELLMQQYNLGIEPKRELYYKLISLGVIKETAEA